MAMGWEKDPAALKLMEACREGWVEEARHILATTGYDPDLTVHGSRPIIEAASGGRVTTVKMLIERGSNVNVTDKRGWTALHAAACPDTTWWGLSDYVSKWRRLEVIRHLLTKGATVSVRDLDGRTALRMAESQEIIEVLEAALKRDEAVLDASAKGHSSTLKMLVASGAGVNARRESDRKTALMLAVEGNHLNCVRILLSAGAAVMNLDRDGRSALLCALDNDCDEEIDEGCPDCVIEGEMCTFDEDCCFGHCDDGTCGPPCIPNERACRSNADCCSGVCAISDNGVGICITG